MDEEVKSGSPKRVFLSGQTTHITIEEEHPGGDEMKPESPADEDDFDLDINSSQLPDAKMGESVSLLTLFLSAYLSTSFGLLYWRTFHVYLCTVFLFQLY